MSDAVPDFDALTLAEAKDLLLRLLVQNAELRAALAEQRDEIARLKGLNVRPQLKPSGMATKATGRQAKTSKGKKTGRRGSKQARLSIDAEDILKATEVPPGLRFKGYEDYILQDLVLQPWTVRYRRERWVTPDGETIVAPLPPGTVGHFGAELRRFVLAQYYRGQVTVPRLLAQLHDVGVDISKRQIVRLLNEGKEAFLGEAQDVLRAGLETARWVTVDDTGARHQASNAVCTQIGDDRFAWFATTSSKSRRNFLELLRAGHGDYVINAEALAYMQKHSLAKPLIARLAEHERKVFPDQAAWQAHLDELGISTLEVTPDPQRVATEGALWGSIAAHGLLQDTVVVSDDAGQFNVGLHALCWIHAERLVHKLDTFTDKHRQAVERIRQRIWWLYADLQSYRREPTSKRKAQLRRRFDNLFRTRTGFVTLDRLLKRLHANKSELLMVLDRPEIPLHTNISENDVRSQVTKRKISGGTRSNLGRDCRDAFLGLMKTCDKLGLSFWHYLGARLNVAKKIDSAPLPQIIRDAA
jgi:hypothetical protein